jgi:hypothetical protein
MALAVAELYIKEKGAPITFGCPVELLPLCDHVPGIEALACRPNNADKEAPPGPFDELSFGRKWDITTSCIEYERALQPNVDRNRPEIWAAKLGLKGRTHPRVYLSAQEQAWAQQWAKKRGLAGRFIVGIVPESYAWVRSWDHWVKALYQLNKVAPEIAPVIIMAGVKSWEAIEFATIGVPVVGCSTRQILSVLSVCNLVAGVDTGPMHSAVGLGIPTLWLFTHIDGRIRTRGYKKAQVIQRTDLECCPCWYEEQCHDPQRFAFCRNITVEQVVDAVLKRYRREKLCSLWSTMMARRRPKPRSATGTTSPGIAGYKVPAYWCPSGEKKHPDFFR